MFVEESADVPDALPVDTWANAEATKKTVTAIAPNCRATLFRTVGPKNLSVTMHFEILSAQGDGHADERQTKQHCAASRKITIEAGASPPQQPRDEQQ